MNFLQTEPRNGITSRKLLIAAAFIIVASIAAVIIIFAIKSRSDTQETVARAVLTRTYGASVQDYENLTSALTQSTIDSKILIDYLHTLYGEQLTDNGYTVFMNNRMPSVAANIAHEENSDLKVSSIELEPEYSSVGNKCFYAFTVKTEIEKDASIKFTFNGHITLIRENGKWKVDGTLPD